jgi:hypothetical protein
MRRFLRRNRVNWQSQTSPKKFLANWLELTEHVRRFLRRLEWHSKTCPKKFPANWLELSEHLVTVGEIE